MDVADIAQRILFAPRTYIIGNGGSFANAMHIANDLQAMNIRAHCMDPATLTAWANDFGYEYVFSKWILLHGEKRDALIALSGSGKSANILNACQAGKIIGMDVIKVFGAEADLGMQDAEQAQLKLGHDIRAWIQSHTRSPAI